MWLRGPLEEPWFGGVVRPNPNPKCLLPSTRFSQVSGSEFRV